MRTLRSRCAALACLLAAGQLQAQTPISESQLLDALSADATLNALAQAPVDRAEAARQQAALFEAPTLGVNRDHAGEDIVEWTWSARWTPPTPGRRGLAMRRAEADLRAVEHASQGERLQLRSDLRAAHGQWATAHGRSESAAALAGDLKELARFVEARAEAGESAGTSARRLALATRRAATSAAREEAEIVQARGRLEALVGPLPEDAVPVLSPLPPLPTTPQVEEHPALLAAQSEQEAEELAVKRGG